MNRLTADYDGGIASDLAVLVYGREISRHAGSAYLQLAGRFGRPPNVHMLPREYPSELYVSEEPAQTPVVVSTRGIAFAPTRALVRGICAVGLPQGDQSTAFHFLDELAKAAEEAAEHAEGEVPLTLVLHTEDAESQWKFRSWCALKQHTVPLWQTKPALLPGAARPERPEEEEGGGLMDNLSLEEHFEKCQAKYGRPGTVAADMMATWRIAGHNEATLRNLCREKLPNNQNILKLLLMKELDSITAMPETHSLTEVIDETAEYFLPSEEGEEANGKPAEPEPPRAESPPPPPPLSDYQYQEATAKFLRELDTKGSAEDCFRSYGGLQNWLYNELRKEKNLAAVEGRELMMDAAAVSKQLARERVHMRDLIKICRDLGRDSVFDLLSGKLALLRLKSGVKAADVVVMTSYFVGRKVELKGRMAQHKVVGGAGNGNGSPLPTPVRAGISTTDLRRKLPQQQRAASEKKKEELPTFTLPQYRVTNNPPSTAEGKRRRIEAPAPSPPPREETAWPGEEGDLEDGGLPDYHPAGGDEEEEPEDGGLPDYHAAAGEDEHEPDDGGLPDYHAAAGEDEQEPDDGGLPDYQPAGGEEVEPGADAGAAGEEEEEEEDGDDDEDGGGWSFKPMHTETDYSTEGVF